MLDPLGRTDTLGVYLVCCRLRGFLFTLCMYIHLISVKTSGLLYHSRMLAFFCLFVEFVFVFLYQKLLHCLDTVSLKSTFTKHKLLLEVFVETHVKFYCLSLIIGVAKQLV